MHTAPPPLPSQPEVAPESPGESRISSGTWAVAGVILLGVFAAISAWLYANGDAVAEGAIIAEIMVEKSSYELIASATGTLQILIAAEVPVRAGAVAARIV